MLSSAEPVCVPAADWVMYPVWLWCAQWARKKSQQGTTSPLAPRPLHFINLSTGRGLPLDRNIFTHTIALTQREEAKADNPQQTEFTEYGGVFRKFTQQKFIFVFLNLHSHRFFNLSNIHPCLYSVVKRITTNLKFYLQYISFFIIFFFIFFNCLPVCFFVRCSLHYIWKVFKNAPQISSLLNF